MNTPLDFSPFTWNEALRRQFEKMLQGPGITWNKQGILNAFDRAVAQVAFDLFAPKKDE